MRSAVDFVVPLVAGRDRFIFVRHDCTDRLLSPLPMLVATPRSPRSFDHSVVKRQIKLIVGQAGVNVGPDLRIDILGDKVSRTVEHHDMHPVRMHAAGRRLDRRLESIDEIRMCTACPSESVL